jgi:hypothetical protein
MGVRQGTVIPNKRARTFLQKRIEEAIRLDPDATTEMLKSRFGVSGTMVNSIMERIGVSSPTARMREEARIREKARIQKKAKDSLPGK